MCLCHSGATTTTTPVLLPLFRTTWESQYQKGRTILDFNEAEVMKWQWHQLDYMQIICTSLQTGNHTSTSSRNFLRIRCSLSGMWIEQGGCYGP